MSKSVIRSAKPYWIYLILTGKKKVEVGKNFPKSKDWNRVVEMYCSKDIRSFNRISEKDREWMRKYLGKIACRFVCDRIEKIEPCFEYYSDGYDLDDDILTDTCLTCEELMQYGKGAPLYGWHISDLVIYDKPRELGEFEQQCFENLYEGIGSKICHKCEHYLRTTMYEPCDCKNDGYKLLTRPPQSWMYVEEV